MDKCFLSVIIPTYRDWSRLQFCLEALSNQDLDEGCFEIVVVNNDPFDPMPPFLQAPKNCKFVDESKPGSYSARNSGVAVAKGEVLVFTDSDCVPDQRWLYEIADYFQKNDGILTGAVKMFSAIDSKVYNFAECYDYIFGINQDLYAEKKVGATANLSVTRSVFFEAGEFNSLLFSGGDVEFCRRAILKGASFHYSGSVKVLHPLRYRLSDLVVKARRLASGKVKVNRISGLGIALLPPLVRLHILFFKKEAPVYIKLKALSVLCYLKSHQVVAAIQSFLGFVGERR